MKRHTFVIVTALAIGITLSACGPLPVADNQQHENYVRQIGKSVDKNGDS
ncbi:hypothetical protein ACQUSY_02615 [Microbacterium sp. YY-03]